MKACRWFVFMMMRKNYIVLLCCLHSQCKASSLSIMGQVEESCEDGISSNTQQNEKGWSLS